MMVIQGPSPVPLNPLPGMQDAGLAEYASERRALEAEAAGAAEGAAWHTAFNALYGPVERHMATLLDVRLLSPPGPCDYAGHVMRCSARCSAAWPHPPV